MISLFNKKHKNFLCCPYCHKKIFFNRTHLTCSHCQKKYQIKNDIPIFKKINCDQSMSEINTPKENPFKYSLHFWLYKKYLKKFLKVQSNDYVLDIGCGIGHCLDYLNKFSNNLIGLDTDLTSLLYAKKATKADYFLSSAEKIPFKDNTFDKIVSFNLLEHLENDQLAVQEMNRVAKDKARILIITPSLEGPRTNSRLKKLMHKEDSGDEKHFREGYYLKDLKQILQNKKIKILKARYTMFLFTELFTEAIKYFYSKKQKRYHRQTDIFNATQSKLFTIYKILIPFIAQITLLEDFLLSYSKKGHFLVIIGEINK